MPSLRYPDTGSRYVFLPTGRPAVGARAYYYSDADLTVPAEIYRDTDGVKGALIAADGDGRVSALLDAFGGQLSFWGPQSGQDRLYMVVNGVASAVDADYNARLDVVETALAGIPVDADLTAEAAARVAGDAASVATASADATSKASAAQAAAIVAAAADATSKANAAQAAAVLRANHTGTQSADTLTDGSTNRLYTSAEKAKLAGVATAATANSSDAQLRDRSTHTGAQAIATVTGLSTALAGKSDLTGYGLERVFPISFGTAANEKADIFFTGTLWATFEVTLVGIFSGANASGTLRATYSLAGSSAGAVYLNAMQYDAVQGLTKDHFALLPAAWDATNSRWKITVAHRTTSTNAVSVRVRWLAPAAEYSNTIRDSIGVSAVYTTDTTVPAAPTPSAVQKGDLFVNVCDAPHNAVGDGVAVDTAAFVSAVATGKPVYVPPGTYKVAPDSITLGADAKLFGIAAAETVIISTTNKTGIGVVLNGANAEVTGLFIRGYGVAIDNRMFHTKIHDNILSYNGIAIDFSLLSYIVRVYKNTVTFNDLGMIVRPAAECYELNITGNIIDNNNGVGVALASNSGGVVIENNTIEGNRNYVSNVGCGLLIKGANMSRLKIDGNWFEENGNHSTSAVDILMLAPGTDSTTGAALRTAIVAVLPASLQATFASGGCAAGAVSIERNGFIFTKYSVVVSGDKAAVAVEKNVFKGIKDKLNRHIVINAPPGSYGLGGTRVDIRNNALVNTDDATIDPQVTTGINGTYVYADSVLTTSTDVFLFNGEDLYARMVSAALNFAAIAAGATAELTATVVGAKPGDPVYLGPPAALESGLMAGARVTAADTVTVRVHNTTAGSVDPAAGTWKIRVVK